MNIVRTLVSVLLGFIFLASSLFSLQTMAATSSSHMIPFQARLHDENGSVLTDGVYQIQTRIYASETGGDDQWTETHSHVSVINGYVNLLLGGITAITDANVQFSAREYYLGIVIGRYHTDGENVDISAELFPRHQLVPSFHAVTASDSARLGGVDADQFAQHSDVVREVGVVADDLANFKSNNFKQESVSFSEGTSETLLSAKNADFLDGIDSDKFLQLADISSINTDVSETKIEVEKLKGYFTIIDSNKKIDSSITIDKSQIVNFPTIPTLRDATSFMGDSMKGHWKDPVSRIVMIWGRGTVPGCPIPRRGNTTPSNLPYCGNHIINNIYDKPIDLLYSSSNVSAPDSSNPSISYLRSRASGIDMEPDPVEDARWKYSVENREVSWFLIGLEN